MMVVAFRSAGRIVNLVVVAVFCWRTRLINSRLTGQTGSQLSLTGVSTSLRRFFALSAVATPFGRMACAAMKRLLIWAYSVYAACPDTASEMDLPAAIASTAWMIARGRKISNAQQVA